MMLLEGTFSSHPATFQTVQAVSTLSVYLGRLSLHLSWYETGAIHRVATLFLLLPVSRKRPLQLRGAWLNGRLVFSLCPADLSIAPL